MARGLVIGIVGAESTGKTSLSMSLQEALATEGHDAVVVPEYLREFCQANVRTPIVTEQAGIAMEQSRRIGQAAQAHDIVIADTTALMIAVYSDIVFGDLSLYPGAQAAHAACALTLLTALDLPWQADGHQRDGPHVRKPVDMLLRAALARAGMSYAVVSGAGERRLQTALMAVRHALDAPSAEDEARSNPMWQWVCERCGDPNCERHLLPRLG